MRTLLTIADCPNRWPAITLRSILMCRVPALFKVLTCWNTFQAGASWDQCIPDWCHTSPSIINSELCEQYTTCWVFLDSSLAVFVHFDICIIVFARLTHGNIIFEILEQSSFQKYTTCWVLCHMLYLFICVFVYWYFCICAFGIYESYFWYPWTLAQTYLHYWFFAHHPTQKAAHYTYTNIFSKKGRIMAFECLFQGSGLLLKQSLFAQPMLVVVVPASMQKLPHLDFELQVVVVSVKVEVLLMCVFCSNVINYATVRHHL